jgi:hypothetical protein
MRARSEAGRAFVSIASRERGCFDSHAFRHESSGVKFALAAAILLGAVAVEAMPFADALKARGVKCRLSGDGRSQLAVAATNDTAGMIAIEIPAGFIAAGERGARIITLREVKLEIEAGHSTEATIPAVALSHDSAALNEAFSVTDEKAPELQPLLEYSAKDNDLPRATAQMVAFLLRSNLTYGQWIDFLRRDSASESHPTPAEVVAAVDGLAIARQLAPKKEFALFGDAELRKRAIRNPWSRAKAMQLFAMELPEGVVAPDFGQLLHTKANDNCPICRMRSRGEEQAGNGL